MPPEGPAPSFDTDSDSDSEPFTALKALGEQIQAEKDKRMQERFVWALGVIIAFDCYIFSHMENWSGPIAITVLELLFLIVIGRMCGVEDISQLVANILRTAGHRMAGSKRQDDEANPS